jgi:hypothetical protein
MDMYCRSTLLESPPSLTKVFCGLPQLLWHVHLVILRCRIALCSYRALNETNRDKSGLTADCNSSLYFYSYAFSSFAGSEEVEQFFLRQYPCPDIDLCIMQTANHSGHAV